MTDAHYHRGGYATFLACADHEFAFFGCHPWQVAEGADGASPSDFKLQISDLRSKLQADVHAGVGEIGLDRLRTKTVPDAQRAAFAAQLALAAELGRPVVLHGAKCWGEVVKACQPSAGRIPAFLFHGFSRSAGLLPQIFALNGFVSLGPALLNDHAVNYREMAKGLPLARVLLETDQEASSEQAGLVDGLAAQLAALRGCAVDEVAAAVEANARRFTEALA